MGMFDFWYEFRHYCKCLIQVPYGGTTRIISIKWVHQGKPTFDLKIGGISHTYNLKLDESIMGGWNNPILFYKKDVADPLHINGLTTGKNSELYHTVLKNKEAKEILEEGQQKIMLVIIGLFVIAIIGIGLYTQYQLSQDNAKILTLTQTIMKMYANATRGIVIH
jgi:hypothetical protein